jgi:phosphopantetheinyl transferase (holo-ACP synthase)
MSRKPVPFQQAWIVKFGLEISTRDIVSSKVTSVLCLFSKHCGRDYNDTDVDGKKRKRKRTNNIKYFTSPWRSDYFVTHLKNQHMSSWEIYKGLSTEEQTNFFNREEKPEAVAMRSFVQREATMKARIFAQQKRLYMIDVEMILKMLNRPKKCHESNCKISIEITYDCEVYSSWHFISQDKSAVSICKRGDRNGNDGIHQRG